MLNTIYLITNDTNGKVYVGQTWQSLRKRFRDHMRKQSYNSKLYRAISKYGKEHFHITELQTCEDQHTADSLECFWIEKFDSIKTGYNIREGGAHGRMSEGSKKLISLAGKGRRMSSSAKKLLSLRMIGNQYRVGKLGPNKGLSKLTLEQFNIILTCNRSCRDLAKEFNCNQSYISYIRRKHTLLA